MAAVGVVMCGVRWDSVLRECLAHKAVAEVRIGGAGVCVLIGKGAGGWEVGVQEGRVVG